MAELFKEPQLLKELFMISCDPGNTVVQTRLNGPINLITLSSSGFVRVDSVSNVVKTVTLSNGGGKHETVILLVESLHTFEADIGRSDLTVGATYTDGPEDNCFCIYLAPFKLDIPGWWV